jgi:hypothetical protein
MSSVEKWNSNSKDGKKLIDMFRKGMIASNAKPKDIRSSVPEFAKFKANSFRAAFYRLKEQYAPDTHKPSGDGLEKLKGKPENVLIGRKNCVLILLIVDVLYVLKLRK